MTMVKPGFHMIVRIVWIVSRLKKCSDDRDDFFFTDDSGTIGTTGRSYGNQALVFKALSYIEEEDTNDCRVVMGKMKGIASTK